MLSRERNARERWKTTVGLISKKNNFFCTFFGRRFAQLQRETSRNFFMEKMSYVFLLTFYFEWI